MITALILGFSSVALLQFFVSYCRSVIAASGARSLSEQVRDVAGIKGQEVSGEEFERLLQLARLCPDSGRNRRAVAAITAYFRLVTIVRSASHKLAPSLISWTERELSGCAYFAATALDQRITYSRGLMAEQFSNQR